MGARTRCQSGTRLAISDRVSPADKSNERSTRFWSRIKGIRIKACACTRTTAEQSATHGPLSLPLAPAPHVVSVAGELVTRAQLCSCDAHVVLYALYMMQGERLLPLSSLLSPLFHLPKRKDVFGPVMLAVQSQILLSTLSLFHLGTETSQEFDSITFSETISSDPHEKKN